MAVSLLKKRFLAHSKLLSLNLQNSAFGLKQLKIDPSGTLQFAKMGSPKIS